VRGGNRPGADHRQRAVVDVGVVGEDVAVEGGVFVVVTLSLLATGASLTAAMVMVTVASALAVIPSWPGR